MANGVLIPYIIPSESVTLTYNTSIYTSGSITCRDSNDLLTFDFALNTNGNLSASGTTLATLPEGHRPSATRNIILTYYDTADSQLKSIQGGIYTTGEIKVFKTTTAPVSFLGALVIMK